MKDFTTVYLIRHGETQFNVEGRFIGMVDVPLNIRGRKQAEYAAAALENTLFDVAYSSPLSRSYETAKIILKNSIGSL